MEESLNKNCQDCFYLGRVHHWPCCDYILKTNQKRPCPPGDKCTVKVARVDYVKKRKKRKGR